MLPLDIDDFEPQSINQQPVDPVGRLGRKQRVRTRDAQAPDFDAMRFDAWQKQREMQRELRLRKTRPNMEIENITAAADMELASLGMPFSLKLQRNGALFSWILLHESEARKGEIAALSEPFSTSQTKDFGALLAAFLTNHAIVI